MLKLMIQELLKLKLLILLRGLEIPRFENVTVDNLNVLFKGEPTLFHTELSGNVDKGNIFIDTYMDLQKEEMAYDISFRSNKLNLFPILNF